MSCEKKYVDTLEMINEARSLDLKPVILNGISKRPLVSDWVNKFSNINWIDLNNEGLYNFGSNVGVLCGRPSNIIVFDIDIQNNGIDNWVALCAENNTKIYDFNTPIVKTGSGGLHYYFLWEEAFEKIKTQLFKNGTSIKGIDVKKNGQVVFPGSAYLTCSNDNKQHKCGAEENNVCLFSGRKYTWIKTPASKNDFSHIPDWLRLYMN
jgi:hypothetical protein